MIELENVSVVVPTADGHTTILEPTTLLLAEPRISIIGSNGSGKSTLARLLNGLIVPSSGTVRVQPGVYPRASPSGLAPDLALSQHELAPPGSEHTQAVGGAATGAQEVSWFDTKHQGAQVRRSVGFVFTDPAAQLVMPTAIEDVALSLRRTHPKKHLRLAAAREALAEFGLDTLADRSVHTLSGGQKQLLAIAAVLATRPAILVADEPTTLLDLRNSLRIRALLMQLSQQTIVVTHDLELAAQADRTLVIDHGRVVFDGLPGEAIDLYRRVAAGEDPEGHGVEEGAGRPPLSASGDAGSTRKSAPGPESDLGT